MRHNTWSLVITLLAVGAMAPAALAGAKPVNLSRAASAEGSVSIENVAGSIRVIAWDKKEITITGTIGEGVETIDFDVQGDRATIEVKLVRGQKNKNGDADLEIHVPRKSSVEVETVSASIEASDIERKAELQSVSGDITLTGHPQRVEIESVSGAVTVRGQTKDVEAASVSGTVHLEGVSGEIEASTVSGALKITGREITRLECESVSGSVSFAGALNREGRYSFDAFSGDIALELPTDTDADVTMSTFSGRVINELSSTKVSGKEVSFILGDGGARLEISTFSGNAVIRPLSG